MSAKTLHTHTKQLKRFCLEPHHNLRHKTISYVRVWVFGLFGGSIPVPRITSGEFAENLRCIHGAFGVFFGEFGQEPSKKI